MRGVAPPLVAFVLIGLLSSAHASTPLPNDPTDRTARAQRAQTARPRDGAGQPEVREHSGMAPLGPAPRLDPIGRFLPPIDPWVQSGFGWGDVATDENGKPLCTTNQVPRTTCDSAGPRPYLHAGFDAMPAPDRTVRASATGRVVAAGYSFAAFVASGPGEGGGVVVLEHDMDGDPATGDDHLVTIYEHVEPLVPRGQIVDQGEVIARTSTVRGEYLHFGVRRISFDPTDADTFRAILPPPGTTGCVPCFGKPSPAPAFPELWEDPAQLFRVPTNWMELLEGGQEGGGDVVETPDGYLVGGWTRAANIDGIEAGDMWLVRLDSEGHIVSQRAYGGPGTDEIHGLLPTADGGYLALARSTSFGAGRLVPLLVKFDPSAEQIQWQRFYTTTGFDWGNDLRATSDGGFVIAGATAPSTGTSRRAMVVKLDTSGEVQWARSFQARLPVPPHTDAYSIAETTDGGYLVLGRVFHGVLGGADLLVFRLDSEGHLIWAKSFLKPNEQDLPGQIEATTDGGAVIVATANSPSLKGIWFLKIDAAGGVERETLYTTLTADSGTRMARTPDGGYVLGGSTVTLFPDFPRPDLWLLKIDAAGQILRQRKFDGRGGIEEVTSLLPTRDGGFVLTGSRDSTCSFCGPGPFPFNLLVVKTDGDLEVSDGCGADTAGGQLSRVSIVQPLALLEESLVVSSSPTDLIAVDTGARSLACDEGSYGAPPVIQSYSVQVSGASVFCDYTKLIEDVVCEAGVPGSEATAPGVLLSGTVEALSLQARVTDADSTPDNNDIVEVKAGIRASLDPAPFSLPLLDDGSSTIVSAVQRVTSFGENCFDDPLSQTCFCTVATYPTSSGDIVMGDSVYTQVKTLINLNQSPLLADCSMGETHRDVLFFSPATDIDVFLSATDRLGNVSTWPSPIRVNSGVSSLSCSGDACGCCLLVGLSGPGGIDQCLGLEGMPSPQFPCGVCIGIAAGCPP